MPVKRNKGGDQISDLLLIIFRLNGAFLRAGDKIAAPSHLTAANWQVLGSVMRADKTVSQIAREMGHSRQAVQRLANNLAKVGQTEYIDNPDDKRASLVRATEMGRAAIADLAQRQYAWANGVARGLDVETLKGCVTTLRGLADRLDEVDQDGR